MGSPAEAGAIASLPESSVLAMSMNCFPVRSSTDSWLAMFGKPGFWLGRLATSGHVRGGGATVGRSVVPA